MTINIRYLADYPDAVPTLARWFRAQWPDYFAGKSQAAIEDGFRDEAQRDAIPVRLLAYMDESLAGTIVLRTSALESVPGVNPGLGGLYVDNAYRRRGIGTALIRAGMDLASGLGYQTVYAGTATAQNLFERLAWESFLTVREGRELVTLYRFDFHHACESY